MIRHHALVGTAIAVLTLIISIVGCTDPGARTVEIPAHAASQQFAAGQVIVNLPYELHHRFEFRNDTSERIEITSIKPSCGCTDVQAPVRSFEPGESGWMDVTATLRGSGGFTTDVAVQWSTGEWTHYALEAFATVARELSLSTATVDLDVASPRTILLSYVDQKGVAPGAVDFEASDAVKVNVGKWKSIIAANKEYGVAARYSATVEIELIESIDSVARVTFGLAGEEEFPRAELVVRTPAIISSYAQEQQARRPSTGPVVIRHASESGADGATEGP